MESQSPLILEKEKPKRKAWIRWMLWMIGILLILSLIVCVGISAYVGWNLTHPQHKLLDSSPADYDLTYMDIEFPSRDGEVLLKGWFLPSEGEAKMTLIFAHGYEGNRLETNLPALSLAKSLVNENYNVVMFDFRNNGESEGNLTSVGQFEKQDLLGAIDWVKAHHPGKIGLIGFSMGAATSLITAAGAKEVVGVVADSPFNNLRTYLTDNLSVWSDLPEFPFTPMIMLIIPPLTGIDVDTVNPLAAVDQIYPRPVLFIHDQGDTAIPDVNSEEMYKKHPDVFSFWNPDVEGHVKAYHENPEEYTQRVIQFFDQLAGN